MRNSIRPAGYACRANAQALVDRIIGAVSASRRRCQARTLVALLDRYDPLVPRTRITVNPRHPIGDMRNQPQQQGQHKYIVDDA
jgi:hypothetical protein